MRLVDGDVLVILPILQSYADERLGMVVVIASLMNEAFSQSDDSS